ATLSRWRERFDSARERHCYQWLSFTTSLRVERLANIRPWTWADGWRVSPPLRHRLPVIVTILAVLCLWLSLTLTEPDSDRFDGRFMRLDLRAALSSALSTQDVQQSGRVSTRRNHLV